MRVKPPVLPKHLTDIEAIELIHGPPETILDVEDFRPYQLWMAEKCIELPGILLGAEMGLGRNWGRPLRDHQASGVGASEGSDHAPLRVAGTWPAGASGLCGARTGL